MNNAYTTATRFAFSLDSSEFGDFAANITDYEIPGVSAQSVTQPTPSRDIPRSGSKIEYEPLAVSVLVDSGFNTFRTLHDWLYRSTVVAEETHDLVAVGYSSTGAPVVQIRYIDAFPVSISGMQFTTSDTSDSIPKFSATFEYTRFVIEDV
jgi:hypothetical protein